VNLAIFDAPVPLTPTLSPREKGERFEAAEGFGISGSKAQNFVSWKSLPDTIRSLPA
jgi:hypothetical protein